MSQQRNFDIICFDCDSTLSRIEGIDELAKISGVGAEVEHLTQIAMDGEIALESVYQRRLALIQPDQQTLASVAQLYIDEIVDGAKDLFQHLQQQNKQIYIISGGLRQAILPLAELLGVSAERVHAVDIYFNEDGSYRDFNQQSPLARSGGKAEICRQLNPNQQNLAMIGDGQTDLESKQAGAYFVGFGGVVERPAVKQQADVYSSHSDLTSLIPHLC